MSDKLTAMRLGGAKLHTIKNQLHTYATVGKTFLEVEHLATQLIKQAGATPNFSLVPGYHWTTCINKNEGIVHGIPDETVIADGDLISIDLGLLWQGCNLDTSISFIAGTTNQDKEDFLAAGRKALAKAIKVSAPGTSVYDLSHQIEKTITRAGFSPTYQLTGHFIGKQLHEQPLIPCIACKADRKKILKVGDTLAIEVMYAQGSCDLIEASDGWTYLTRDHSLTALFEDTIAITPTGAEILT